MKKFIAPTVRVIKYESNIICGSREDGGDTGYTEGGDGNISGNDDGEFYAPSRRIFGE